MTFTNEELDLIVAALSLLQETDDEHGYLEEARKARTLVDKIQNRSEA